MTPKHDAPLTQLLTALKGELRQYAQQYLQNSTQDGVLDNLEGGSRESSQDLFQGSAHANGEPEFGMAAGSGAAKAAVIDLCLVDYLTNLERASLLRGALAQVIAPPAVALKENANGAGDPEPLVPVPSTCALALPHAYASFGAPYAGVSPFQMRRGASERLAQAQAWLSERRPDYQLQIFDAYRPVTVQAFMVAYALKQSLAEQGISEAEFAAQPDFPLHQQIRQRVSEIWAQPSMDPQTPPPHATGAAVDLTIIDGDGMPLEMGCPIDHLGPEAEANYYIRQQQADHPAHQNRCLLQDCMVHAGFKRLPMSGGIFRLVTNGGRC